MFESIQLLTGFEGNSCFVEDRSVFPKPQDRGHNRFEGSANPSLPEKKQKKVNIVKLFINKKTNIVEDPKSSLAVLLSKLTSFLSYFH